MEQRLGEATTSAPVGLVENHTPMAPPSDEVPPRDEKEEETVRLASWPVMHSPPGAFVVCRNHPERRV